MGQTCTNNVLAFGDYELQMDFVRKVFKLFVMGAGGTAVRVKILMQIKPFIKHNQRSHHVVLHCFALINRFIVR